MKNYYLITKECTKYWKKAIKNDRVMVTNRNEKIYIVNGYNAFIFPAMPLIWDEYARPAFMVEMPEDGQTFQYLRGEKQPAISDDIVNILERNIKDKTPAERTPFIVEHKNGMLRLFKNENGSVSGVNVKYDSMVDFTFAENIYCGGRYAPVIAQDEHFTALLMPVKLADIFPDQVRDTFGKFWEEK